MPPKGKKRGGKQRGGDSDDDAPKGRAGRRNKQDDLELAAADAVDDSPTVQGADADDNAEPVVRAAPAARVKAVTNAFAALSMEDEGNENGADAEPASRAGGKRGKKGAAAKQTAAAAAASSSNNDDETPNGDADADGATAADDEGEGEAAGPAAAAAAAAPAGKGKRGKQGRVAKQQAAAAKAQERKAAKTQRQQVAAEGAASSSSAAAAAGAAEHEQVDAPWFVDIKGRYKKVTRDITIENLHTTMSGKLLIKDGTRLTLVYGKKYGIVGRNGLGKSVLMRKIAAREELGIPLHIKILHVEQEVIGDESTPIESVLKSDEEREWLLNEEKKLLAEREAEERGELEDIPDRTYDLNDIYERLREIDADKAEGRAAAILAGLGFDREEIKTKPTKAYSGGWRMRIALARALFCQPDYLLLDEPNNHLDMVACIWLESYLQRWKKTLLVVSHDSAFLNEFVDHILHLHQQTITDYRGDYEAFCKQRAANRRAKEKKSKANEVKTAKMTAFIQRNKTSTQAKQAKSRQRLLDRLENVELDTDDPTLRFSFPECGALGPIPLKFKKVSFGYEGQKAIFKNLEFGLDTDSRVALVGYNGVGKSTLMKLMVGELEPTSGHIERDRHMRVAKFSQHHVDQLVYADTVIEYLQKKFPGAQTQDVRNHVAKFGLVGNLALQKIETLSGGQKSRVAFAELCWQKPHMLFLDEPSNHLDVEMIESLAKALAEFDGGVVVISHNQYLVQLVCDEIWVVGNRAATKFEGAFEDYKQAVADENFGDSDDD